NACPACAAKRPRCARRPVAAPIRARWFRLREVRASSSLIERGYPCALASRQRNSFGDAHVSTLPRDSNDRGRKATQTSQNFVTTGGLILIEASDPELKQVDRS